MAGHSKWANIRHKKEKTDAQKAKIFTKIGREIAVAVKLGGTDPANNPKLRDIIAKARANNIPNDNITRSIKKAAGELGSVNYEEITYEGYGGNGVAVIVDTLTYNKNRTAADMRHLFDKYGGSLGTTGCVSFMFDTKGVVIAERNEPQKDEEIMLQAIDLGAEEIFPEGDQYEILTDPGNLGRMREGLEGLGLNILSAELDKIPQTTVKLEGEDAQKFQAFLEKLEENDDVQNVYHNAELPEEVSEE
ncbi:MAG: YebC/PmpR family DNA-binding transcriptional regulator [Clostridiales bacterium]|jgi:YebC/PmpR family DNA-binding regulatory protein|nr:YebC/PmpR family DNA-binding transcriptional regulator [Clostridiales bacterium]